MYVPKFPEVRAKNSRRLLELLEGGNVPDLITVRIRQFLDKTDYYEAPASTRFHGARPGGLFEHSVAVTLNLVKWTKMGLVDWERPYSPYLVGLLHDLCKVGKYEPVLVTEGVVDPDTGIKAPDLYEFRYAEESWGFGGHGEDSVGKLLLEVPITPEEAMAIRWHMGAYEKDKWDKFDRAIRAFPCVLWTHHADMVASKVEGV